MVFITIDINKNFWWCHRRWTSASTASQPTSLVAETWSLGDVPNRPITTTFGAPLGGANGADGNNMDL